MHSSAAAALVALALLVVPTASHSWVQELDVIDPKTSQFTGAPGYSRNSTPQTAPGFSDELMVKILPGLGQPAIEQRDTIPALDTTGVTASETLCKNTQRTQFQSAGNPRLQAAPGDLVALRYQENGHVTLPQNQPGKPANRGWVYIYGTTQPKFPEVFLDVFGQWNAEGTGGDKRGKLLAKQPFDDGQCYQINSGSISAQRQAQYPHTANVLMGANLWCQNDIALPADVATGSPYTLYWVWDWPTAPGADPNLPKGKAELYTTCMDVDIVAKPASKRRVKGRQAPSPVSSSDLNSAAIPAYVSSLTASPAPVGAATAVSAQASPASPESSVTPSAGAPAANPPSPAPSPAPGPAGNAVANAGVNSAIGDAVSAAVIAGAPTAPLTITIDIVESIISPVAAGAAVATQPAAVPVSTPAAAPAPMAPADKAPAASEAPSAAPAAPAPAAPAPASPAPPIAATSSPVQAPVAVASSMPPKNLQINPPVLSGSPSTSTTVSLPVFSGTATPVAAVAATPALAASPVVAASPAVAASPVAAPGTAKSSTSPMMASGASQNGTVSAKGQCGATTCKSKRQSKIFGKKSGGKRL